MSAAQIPNLLDSLRSRGGGNNGGRGRGGPRLRPKPQTSPDHSLPAPNSTATTTTDEPHEPGISADTVIQATDGDAAGSRLSAVRVGWLADEFAPGFAAGVPDRAHVRRMPIINRGTYVRTTAVDTLVGDFLERYAGDAAARPKTCQVVSLGAGTDTRWPRFWQSPRRAQMQRCRWIELDFPPVAQAKQELVRSVSNLLPGAELDRDWACVGLDLRELIDADDHDSNTSASASRQQLEVLLHRSLPTLLLSEMCLTYLPPRTASTPILRHFTRTALAPDTPVHAVLYEPLAPHDAFGRTMIQNLAARGIRLPGLEALPDLNSHGERLKAEAGFDGHGAETVGGWWRARVSAADKERLRQVEMVDEEEEWELLAGHYGIIWAWRHARAAAE